MPAAGKVDKARFGKEANRRCLEFADFILRGTKTDFAPVEF
ncbi:MAG: hypothetical protein WA214_23820 [Pseudolabrys sp.]